MFKFHSIGVEASRCSKYGYEVNDEVRLLQTYQNYAQQTSWPLRVDPWRAVIVDLRSTDVGSGQPMSAVENPSPEQ